MKLENVKNVSALLTRGIQSLFSGESWGSKKELPQFLNREIVAHEPQFRTLTFCANTACTSTTPETHTRKVPKRENTCFGIQVGLRKSCRRMFANSASESWFSREQMTAGNYEMTRGWKCPAIEIFLSQGPYRVSARESHLISRRSERIRTETPRCGWRREHNCALTARWMRASFFVCPFISFFFFCR